MNTQRPLFPEPRTTRTSPLGSTEPMVHWLTQSTRPEAVTARMHINAWYAQFPDPPKKLTSDLKSRNDTAHVGALDELYVHHLLCQRHTDIRYEVGGVGPDFRIYQNDTCVSAIEVLSLFQPSDWSSELDQHGRIADQINARIKPTAGYFVDFRIERADRDPAYKRLAGFLEASLAELPPPEQLISTLSGSERISNALPTRFYVEDGVRIRIRFLPMNPGAPSRTNPDARIVGAGPIVGGFIQSAQRMKARIRDKAGGRYDIGDAPFAVAVGIHDPFAETEEYITALYGRAMLDTPSGQLARGGDGLFGTDREKPAGRHRRISAVIAINRLCLWQPDTADIALLHNPHAEHPWPADTIPTTRSFAPDPAATTGPT